MVVELKLAELATPYRHNEVWYVLRLSKWLRLIYTTCAYTSSPFFSVKGQSKIRCAKSPGKNKEPLRTAYVSTYYTHTNIRAWDRNKSPFRKLSKGNFYGPYWRSYRSTHCYYHCIVESITTTGIITYGVCGNSNTGGPKIVSTYRLDF